MAKEILSTQEILEIEQIRGNTIVMKGGGLRKVILTSGENFDLLSDEDRDLLIFSYQDLLNSLNFSIQIIVHSRKVNIEGYLRYIKAREAQEDNSLLKTITNDYHQFIDNFVGKNPIMSKTFFIVVPFEPIITTKKIIGMFKKNKKKAAPVNSGQEFNNNLKQLELRVDRVIDGLNRIGLRGVPLIEEEIIELLYNFYNPSTIEKREITSA